MGGPLFDRFGDWTAQADDILGYSIRELCVDDPRSELGLTQFTQPALFVVNAMTYRARLEDGAAPPQYVAGHSLGEYNALLASGAFDFATGLKLVKRRGALMGQVSGGGMAAIIGWNRADSGNPRDDRRGPAARRGELQFIRADRHRRSRPPTSPP
jgi:malonyl CoA-acyl carrier protein transacylase